VRAQTDLIKSLKDRLTSADNKLGQTLGDCKELSNVLGQTKAVASSLAEENSRIQATNKDLTNKIDAYSTELSSIKEATKVKDDQIILLKESSVSSHAVNTILQSKLHTAETGKDAAMDKLVATLEDTIKNYREDNTSREIKNRVSGI
jgi:chromosome segregation ATPase